MLSSLFGRKKPKKDKPKDGDSSHRPSSGSVKSISFSYCSPSSSRKASSSTKSSSKRSSSTIEGLGKSRSLQDYQKRMSVKQLESVMMTESYFDINESS